MKKTNRALIGISFLAATSAFGQWTGVSLRPAGAGDSFATGGAGNWQGGYATIGTEYHAGRWSSTAGSWVDMHPASKTSSRVLAAGVNVLVGYTYDGSIRAALWSASTGTWIDMQPPASPAAVIRGTNGTTHVGDVGGAAAMWSGTSTAYGNLHPTFAGSSYAFAVSGTQVVGYFNYILGPAHAALWFGSRDSMVDLNPAAASGSLGFGCHNGQQVGYAVVTNHHRASLWTGSAGSWVDLTPQSIQDSNAYAVYNGTQVGDVTVGLYTHASLWNGTAASWVDLHPFLPAGYVRSSASAIWVDGNNTYIAGTALWGNREEAVLWIRTNPCAADFNSDGTLDFFDYLDFVEAFANSAIAADFNHDAVIDFFDYLDFVQSFSTGC